MQALDNFDFDGSERGVERDGKHFAFDQHLGKIRGVRGHYGERCGKNAGRCRWPSHAKQRAAPGICTRYMHWRRELHAEDNPHFDDAGRCSSQRKQTRGAGDQRDGEASRTCGRKKRDRFYADGRGR